MSSSSTERPLVLVVAGHDSSGAAGLDADLDAARALGVETALVATAHTVQDARSVHSVGARDPQTWLAEALAVGNPAALKLGLLPGVAHVAAAARLVETLRALDGALPVVLDPVLVASSGFAFLEEAARDALREMLGPPGVIWTPNLPEAAALTGRAEGELSRSLCARVEVAGELLGAGARGVLLKAGHGVEDPLRDLLLESGREPVWIGGARREGPSLRGSGCRHATALAAGLARGEPLEAAARGAHALVCARLEAPAGGRS